MKLSAVIVALVLLEGCVVDFSTKHQADGGAVCGNGIAETGESCDGTDLAGQTCQTLGQGQGTLRCRADCGGYVIVDCGPQGCGNGVMEPPQEQCDGDDLGGATCASLGLQGGELSCALDCRALDTSGCELRPSGGACTQGTQCAGGICFTEGVTGYPGGFCTMECVTTEDCAPEQYCVTPAGEAMGHCYPDCTVSQTDPGCRPGYACFQVHDADAGVCWPHCLENAHCSFTDICNRWSGRCETVPAASENGGACTKDSQCLGERCLTDASDGYCASPCALSDGVCPSADVCVPYYSPERADLGLCLEPCESAADCREGLDCYDPFSVGDPVCWP